MSNLTDKLVKVRTLLDSGDVAEILKGIGLFQPLYDECKRNVNRFCKDDNHKLTFCSGDLQDIAESCKIVLGNLNQRVNVSKMLREVDKLEVINDKNMGIFTKDYCDVFYLIARLNEFHNIMCYLTVLLHLLEVAYEAGELVHFSN